MPFSIVCQDITKMDVDAIVNIANTALRMGGGVCGAVFQAAGANKLQEACNKLAPISTGEAVITPGFDLPANYIIHAASPIYHPLKKKQCEKQLYSAYQNSLKLAKENGCKNIAFPLISSEIYGYPKDKALEVAIRAITDFLKEEGWKESLANDTGTGKDERTSSEGRTKDAEGRIRNSKARTEGRTKDTEDRTGDAVGRTKDTEDRIGDTVGQTRDSEARNDLDVYLVIYDKTSFQPNKKLLGKVDRYLEKHYVQMPPIPAYLQEDEKFSMLEAGVLNASEPKSKKKKKTISRQKPAPFSAPFPSSAPTPASSSPNSGLKAAQQLYAQPAQASIPKPASYPAIAPFQQISKASLESLINRLDEPFSDTLLKLIDAKGKTDVEVYKKANIDRRLFSKIRKGKGYTPRKNTILALAIALELSLDETGDLLQKAGYALSHSSKFDVIVEFFIVNQNYNIFEINEVLFQYDQPLLGASYA